MNARVKLAVNGCDPFGLLEAGSYQGLLDFGREKESRLVHGRVPVRIQCQPGTEKVDAPFGR
jgi:hypothetical protein